MAEDFPKGTPLKKVLEGIRKAQGFGSLESPAMTPEDAVELQDLIESTDVAIAQLAAYGMSADILQDIKAAFEAAKLGHKEEVDALRAQYKHLKILAGLDRIVALVTGAK